MNRLRCCSIRSRITLSVIAVTGLILLAVIYWSYEESRSRLKEDMKGQAVFLAEGAARSVDARLGGLQGLVNGMALSLQSRISSPGSSRKAALAHLDIHCIRKMQLGALEKHPEIYGISVAVQPDLTPENWHLSVPSFCRNVIDEQTGAPLLYDLADAGMGYELEDWYILPKYLEKAVWSEPYIRDEVLMVTYSAPFYLVLESSRIFAGVVSCDLTLEWLERLIAGLPLGTGGYGLIMSRRGTYVSHPDPDIVLNETVFSIADEKGDAELRRIGQKMISGNPGIMPFCSFVTGEQSWLAWTPLTSSDWIMAALISWEDMHRAIGDLSRRQTFIGLLGLLLLAFAAGIIARTITRPVTELKAAADNLAGGELDTVLPVPRGQDEVAGLTRSFAIMRDNLRSYMDDLSDTAAALSETVKKLDRKLYEMSLLNRVARRMNSSNELEGLLKGLLEDCTEAFEADAVALFLNDENISGLEIRVSHGLEDEDRAEIKAKMVEIAGQSYEQDRSILRNEDASGGHLISAALTLDSGPVGAIVVLRQEQPFCDNDLNLLNSLAVPSAAAIARSRLYELAIKDGMTKLYIHRYFQGRLKEEIKRCLRYDTPFSLLLTDIDHFKSFNDTYGHQQGDLVLIEVAQLLMKHSRLDVDIPARYGGEEFAIILPDTPIEGARQMAERLREAVETHEFSGQDEPLHVTMSIGIAFFPDHAEDGKGLIECADKALYVSKESGRNRVTLWQPEE